MEKKKIIIPAAVVVLLIIVISIISVVTKNMPSKKHIILMYKMARYSLFYRMNQVVHQVYMKMARFTLTWVQ